MKITEFFDKLCGCVSSLFKDKGDGWSSNRAAFLYTVFISNILILGVWTGLSIYNKQLIVMPESIIVIYCLANGLVTASKLIQKPMETKKESDNV